MMHSLMLLFELLIRNIIFNDQKCMIHVPLCHIYQTSWSGKHQRLRERNEDRDGQGRAIEDGRPGSVLPLMMDSQVPARYGIPFTNMLVGIRSAYMLRPGAGEHVCNDFNRF